MYIKVLAACLAVFLFPTAANAQKAEATISLNEAFFDALLDSVFLNVSPLEFTIAQNPGNRQNSETHPGFNSSFLPTSSSSKISSSRSDCRETVRILREASGVRTAVRFREGKVYVPLAFNGSYAPPFIGCVEFAGWAEANIDLEFDQAGQRLIGRARILNVNLNGTGGLGGTVIARLIQRSIDKKLNPIEVIRLDKLSFGLPIQNTGNIKVKATAVRPEISNGALNIRIVYEFLKG